MVLKTHKRPIFCSFRGFGFFSQKPRGLIVSFLLLGSFLPKSPFKKSIIAFLCCPRTIPSGKKLKIPSCLFLFFYISFFFLPSSKKTKICQPFPFFQTQVATIAKFVTNFLSLLHLFLVYLKKLFGETLVQLDGCNKSVFLNNSRSVKSLVV